MPAWRLQRLLAPVSSFTDGLQQVVTLHVHAFHRDSVRRLRFHVTRRGLCECSTYRAANVQPIEEGNVCNGYMRTVRGGSTLHSTNWGA
jgi:hypothetical protein